MCPKSDETVTDLLAAFEVGDRKARDRLFELVYAELRDLAQKVRIGRANETLDTTALANEAYVKLVGGGSISLRDRGHFFAVAARAMRQILVDEARRRAAKKRGGGDVWSVTFHEDARAAPVRGDQLIDLHEALERLEALDARSAKVVEQRFFVGLTLAETAEALGVSTATVERDWRAARAWLVKELSGGGDDT